MNTANTLVLDFEKTIVEIEAKIESLKLLAQEEDVDISKEVARLQEKLTGHLLFKLNAVAKSTGGPPSG